MKVRGKDIVDEAGRPIRLKGVNLGGWLLMEGYILGGRNIPQKEFIKKLKRRVGEKETENFVWKFRNNFIRELDIKNLRDLGFNCARVPFHYRFVEEAPYRYSKGGLEYLDKVLAWLEKYNIYCILDLHAAPGAQNRDWHSDSSGEALLWGKETYRDRCVALWRKLADRCKERRCIAGYDPLNEPVTQDDRLNRLYKRIIEAIRSSDKNHIIFLEGNRWAQDLSGLPAPPDSNIAYSIHFYEPLDFTFNFRPGLAYPGKIDGERWDRSKIVRRLRPHVRFRDRYKVPIYVGEFGVNSRYPVGGSELKWVKDCLSVFDELDFHWSYWTYKSVAGAVFPDGVYRLLDNKKWAWSDSATRGWENFIFLSRPEREKALKSLRTENFTELKVLSKILKRGK